MCRELIQQDQSLIDIWLVVANLYAVNGDKDATSQVDYSHQLSERFFLLTYSSDNTLNTQRAKCLIGVGIVSFSVNIKKVIVTKKKFNVRLLLVLRGHAGFFPRHNGQ